MDTNLFLLLLLFSSSCRNCLSCWFCLASWESLSVWSRVRACVSSEHSPSDWWLPDRDKDLDSLGWELVGSWSELINLTIWNRNMFWFWRYLTLTLIYKKGLNFSSVGLWNHPQICSWNQPVLSYEGKVSCLRKQCELFMGFELNIDRLPVSCATYWATLPLMRPAEWCGFLVFQSVVVWIILSYQISRNCFNFNFYFYFF